MFISPYVHFPPTGVNEEEASTSSACIKSGIPSWPHCNMLWYTWAPAKCNKLCRAFSGSKMKNTSFFRERDRELWLTGTASPMPLSQHSASTSSGPAWLPNEWCKNIFRAFVLVKIKKRNRQSKNLPYSQRELWLSGTASLMRLSRAASTVNCLYLLMPSGGTLTVY